MNDILKKRKKKKIIIFGSLGLLVLIIVGLVIFRGKKEDIVSVQTEKVTRRTITQTVTATGTIDPEFKVVITPEVTGEIVALPVKEGDVVRKGDLLVKIRQDAYLASKQRADANLQSAKAALSSRKAELDKITAEYKRVQELHAKKLISDSELESARSQFLSSQALLEASEANVSQSEASLKETMEQLYKTTIHAPIDGIVTQLKVELGERVLGSGFSPGTVMMTVADLSKMVAIVDVDENDIVLVTAGDAAKVKIDAFGDREFPGVVYQIGNSAKTTGLGTQDQVINFEVRIRLTDPDKSIRPGMSCNTSVETETKDNVLTVPIPSVTTRDEEKPAKVEPQEDEVLNASNGKKKEGRKNEIIFAVENSKVKAQKVKTGISDDNYIEITEGAKGGEEVVSGSYKAISRDLHDGAVIRVENKKDDKGDGKK
jgi:HlyD family secretion protein